MSDIFCLPETCKLTTSEIFTSVPFIQPIFLSNFFLLGLISDVINFLTKTNSTFEPHIIYEDVTRAVNMV
jgi:hypothetical protein